MQGTAGARTMHTVPEMVGVERSAAGGIGDAACVQASDMAGRVSFMAFLTVVDGGDVGGIDGGDVARVGG